MPLPDGFCDLKELIPDAVIDIWYASAHNLTGKPLRGYGANRALGTIPMGAALKNVARDAGQKGYRLHLFDAYRPQKAVDDFAAWAAMPEDGKTKQEFYPHVQKERLFELGYIIRKSGHSRGSAVDLTLEDRRGCLDMGTHFDLMDEASHHDAAGLSDRQRENRRLLKSLMETHGFVCYQNEWWHYRFEPELFPDTYFDFDIM